MLELQEKGYSEEAILNTKIESQKLQDLEYLKQQLNPGPFISAEQVKTFVEQILECKEKINECILKRDSKRRLVNFSKKIIQYFV